MTESHDTREHVADAVGAGEPTSIPDTLGLLDGLIGALLQGSSLGRAGVGLSAELARISLGRSQVTPEKGDWRFKDVTWSQNPAYRALAQCYLATCGAVDHVLNEMQERGPSHRVARARFALGILTSALAPTNTLFGNPAALKKTLETGGTNLRSGFANFLRDLRTNGGMPSMAKAGALTVGEDLAITPGSVVDKDEYAEVLQYVPTTETVRQRPMLVVPPPIGRYYFLDLQPGRSFVEYAVSRGLQTFMLSWRNPSPKESDWDLDTYAGRILSAVDAVREITASDDVNVIAFCAGGILNTMVLNHLAHTGDDRIHSASYAVTLLDWGVPAPIGAFSSPRLLSLARWNSTRAGIISARQMSSAFTWMRPNELVWNYWVNNYLMGEDPPVFDILTWNADGTNLPATLHKQFLDIFERNPMPEPGAMEALGTPVELQTIKVPNYVMGAINDHLTPWHGTYRTGQLLAGESTFTLSSAGHIASQVNPPGNPKASYSTGPVDPHVGPEVWLETAQRHSGTWWDHWAQWAIERSGEELPAPKQQGSVHHPPQALAPGSYVRQRN
jgi:polyhydroxyalkanoate synthase subunit PhaC